MDLKITTLDGKEAGSVTLDKDIFGLEPRKDLIQRCIVWQLAKRRAGTHAVKNRADMIEENFGRAARNIPNIDVLPIQGINVYDILRRQKLVLTKAAVEALEARFK